MGTLKFNLDAHGLEKYWTTSGVAAALGKPAWKNKVYEAVNATTDANRAARIADRPSALAYTKLKDWGPNPREYSFSSGEVERLGQHVPERYLDDRLNLKGTRIKMLCRLGCLPLMERVGRELRPPWPREYRTCAVCDTGRVEDIQHFMMECPGYEARRTVLTRQIIRELVKSNGNLTAVGFANMPPPDQLAVLLGKRISDPATEDRIDRKVKRFLSKCWNLRGEVTNAVNGALFTSYGIYSAPVA